jgi:hypothetical protein
MVAIEMWDRGCRRMRVGFVCADSLVMYDQDVRRSTRSRVSSALVSAFLVRLAGFVRA